MYYPFENMLLILVEIASEFALMATPLSEILSSFVPILTELLFMAFMLVFI